MSNTELYALIIIFLVSIGTYGLRLSGLLLSGKISNEGKIRIFLDYLPPTLLLSFVTPVILNEGLAGFVACFFIAVCWNFRAAGTEEICSGKKSGRIRT